MEDQQNYHLDGLGGQTGKAHEWRMKKLAPFSNDFENRLYNDLEQIADDTRIAPLDSDKMGTVFRLAPMVYKCQMLGYFLTEIHGPGNYRAYGVATTPYIVPLMLIEYNPDKLQALTGSGVEETTASTSSAVDVDWEDK
jgi:hypothetical protein